MPPETEFSKERIRVLRIIARMNIGGPAHHVAILSRALDNTRFRTCLVHGKVGTGEESLAALASKGEVRVIDDLSPEISPLLDLRALVRIRRLMSEFRPDIVHTHTAKAGMLGRLAACMARNRRPVIVHTYHGHVLEGYFPAHVNRAFRLMERALGLISDCLIGVSSATVDDLVRMKVAPRTRFRVVRVGLELESFLTSSEEAGAEFRARVGIDRGDVVVTFMGRLVPIKRVDVLLRAFADLHTRVPQARLVVAGDGPLRAGLEALADELAIRPAVSFLGYVWDLPAVVAATDIAALTSDNEGTPVALIEASAGGCPAVATEVGGVAEVVTPQTGRLVPPRDVSALAHALSELAVDKSLRARLGGGAREHVRDRFSSGRLVHDIEQLYGELLQARSAGGSR